MHREDSPDEQTISARCIDCRWQPNKSQVKDDSKYVRLDMCVKYMQLSIGENYR